MTVPILCLDNGYVRLIDVMGTDESIVRAARVSFDADGKTGEDPAKDEKLIRYLWKNRHTTPFESCTLSYEVKAPIFVFRQWHRHRTQSYNEVSARYTELPEEFYTPTAENIGQQSTSSKQARLVGVVETSQLPAIEGQLGAYQDHCLLAFEEYRYLLASGWPRELARMVLPLSTYSRMLTTMNLRNLFHFLELRLHPHAQYEIRVYAQAMLYFARSSFPIAVVAFEEGLANGTK